MRISILLIEQIAVLFLIAFVGYLLVKKNILREEDSKVISWLVAFILSPCVIVKSFQIDYTTDKLVGFGIAILAAIFAQGLHIVVSKVMEKPCHLSNIDRASIIYSNCGYLIVPLVTFVLGEEWVFYCSAYMMVANILTWTHMLALVSDGREGSNLKKVVLNPNIIAIIIGLVLFFTGLRVPVVLEGAIDGFGGAIGFVSMLVVGMLIGNVELSEIFRNKQSYVVCGFRLLILPIIEAVIFAFAVRMNIHPDAGKILLISLLAACAPVAVMITQQATLYDGDAKYASMVNVMSVIFCVVTMPLIVLLYEMMI